MVVRESLDVEVMCSIKYKQDDYELAMKKKNWEHKERKQEHSLYSENRFNFLKEQNKVKHIWPAQSLWESETWMKILFGKFIYILCLHAKLSGIIQIPRVLST